VLRAALWWQAATRSAAVFRGLSHVFHLLVLPVGLYRQHLIREPAEADSRPWLGVPAARSLAVAAFCLLASRKFMAVSRRALHLGIELFASLGSKRLRSLWAQLFELVAFHPRCGLKTQELSMSRFWLLDST